MLIDTAALTCRLLRRPYTCSRARHRCVQSSARRCSISAVASARRASRAARPVVGPHLDGLRPKLPATPPERSTIQAQLGLASSKRLERCSSSTSTRPASSSTCARAAATARSSSSARRRSNSSRPKDRATPRLTRRGARRVRADRLCLRLLGSRPASQRVPADAAGPAGAETPPRRALAGSNVTPRARQIIPLDLRKGSRSAASSDSRGQSTCRHHDQRDPGKPGDNDLRPAAARVCRDWPQPRTNGGTSRDGRGHRPLHRLRRWHRLPGPAGPHRTNCGVRSRSKRKGVPEQRWATLAVTACRSVAGTNRADHERDSGQREHGGRAARHVIVRGCAIGILRVSASGRLAQHSVSFVSITSTLHGREHLTFKGTITSASPPENAAVGHNTKTEHATRAMRWSLAPQ